MKSAQPYQTTSQGYEEGIHWSRRIFHTSNGILALLFYHRDKVLFQKVVGYLLVLLICLECIRLHSSWLNELASRLFYPIMRKNETRRFSGMGYYLAGVLYASCYFDSVVFDLVVIHLAIGDPIAAIFGICFGNPRKKRWKNGKNMAGFLACWWICMWSTLCYLYWKQGKLCFVISIVSSFVSALVESCTPTPQYILSPFPTLFPFGLDDNLLIPLITSPILHFLFRFYLSS